MALGYESAVINGQLVNVAPAQSFSPLTYGATLSGPGYWPRNGQWNLPPLLPSASSQTANASYSPSGPTSGSPMPTTGSVNSSGQVNWMHPTKSPVLWALAFIVGSLFMLHKVHYR